MIFYKPLRTTQIQVKCILSNDMSTHEKYDPNNLKEKTDLWRINHGRVVALSSRFLQNLLGLSLCLCFEREPQTKVVFVF